MAPTFPIFLRNTAIGEHGIASTWNQATVIRAYGLAAKTYTAARARASTRRQPGAGVDVHQPLASGTQETNKLTMQ